MIRMVWRQYGVVDCRGPMAQFDPRRQPMRLAPHLLTTAAAVGIALVAGQAYEPVRAEEVPALTSEQIAYLETQAYAAAGAPAGLTAPEAIPVQSPRGGTFGQALRRTRTGARSRQASSMSSSSWSRSTRSRSTRVAP